MVVRTSERGGACRARAEWLPEIVAFADSVFRPSGRGSMARDYPCLFDPENAQHLFVHRRDGRTRGLVGTLLCELLLGGRHVRAASIGAVATAPRLRGGGIAAALLELAERALRAEGSRLVLISGDGALYRRFGAVPVGGVRWYRLEERGTGGRRLAVTRLGRDQLPALARLYGGRRTRYVRTLATVERLFAAAGFAAAEQGEQTGFLASDGAGPRAYAIVVTDARHYPGVGLVSEWAGDAEGLLAIFDAAAAASAKGLLIPLLEEDAELAERLPGSSAVSVEPFPYTVKVIDGVGLWEDLGYPGGLALGESRPGAYVLGERHGAPTLTAAELTSLLFARSQASEPLPAALSSACPFPFVWPQGLNYV